MTVFTIAQITREFNVTKVVLGIPISIDHQSILPVFTSVNAMDHGLEVNGLGRHFISRSSIDVSPVRAVTGYTIVCVGPVITMEDQVGVTILTQGIINNHAPRNSGGIGYCKLQGYAF